MRKLEKYKIYPVVAYGDPVLKKVAKEFEVGDPSIGVLVQDMFATMSKADGVGLAAPQIGISKRLFVINTVSKKGNDDEEGMKKAFINAQMLDESGAPWSFEEGCLSIPSIYEKVSRKPNIRIRYYDEDWKLHEEVFADMEARVIQHEYDHIEGILFLDHLSAFKRKLLKGKLTKISKGIADHHYKMKFYAS